MVPDIDRNILAVGQLMDEPLIDVNINETYCMILNDVVVIARGRKYKYRL